MTPDKNTLIVGAAVLGLGVAALYVWKKGGAANAAAAVGQAAGSAAVAVVGGVATGTVNAVSNAVSLPTTDQTTTDPKVARWIIDNAGHFEATKWAGVPALAKALFMAPGSGYPPPAGSAAGKRFASLIAATTGPDTGDETARLLVRYPTGSSGASIYSGWTEPDYSFGSNTGQAAGLLGNTGNLYSLG